MDEARILGIERPHPNLLKLYVIRALLTGPGALLALPILYFRYHTMRLRFDREGVSLSVGLLFRKQVNLTYARIQDIHLTSGLLQRWLGLADVQVQTASGSAGAELVIEGLLEYEAVRDFLYTRMRGFHDAGAGASPAGGGGVAAAARPATGTEALLREIHAELRGARVALEKRAGGSHG